jgi:multidrug resistance efflux pump
MFPVLGSGGSEGLYGLIGVLIGGVLTGIVTAVLDSRRRRREFRVALAEASADLEEAARALDATQRNLARYVEQQDAEEPPAPEDLASWPVGWNRKTWSQAWSRYRPALAAKLSNQDFRRVATAFGYVEQLQGGLMDPGHAFQKDDPEFLTNVEQALSAARPILVKPRDAAAVGSRPRERGGSDGQVHRPR